MSNICLFSVPCKAIAAGETALLDNTVCNRQYNVFDCDWDGGDCCAITCGWDRTPDSRGGCDEEDAFDCRDPDPAIPTPPPPNGESELPVRV